MNLVHKQSPGWRTVFAILLPLAAAVSGQAMRMPAARAARSASSIVRDPSDLPAPVGTRGPELVRVPLAAQEVVGALDPAAGVYYRYWTFNGKVPGPMIRVRVGDTVELTLHNDAGDKMVHSIDLHAVLGPGGGAAIMQVEPGRSKSFTFVATVPGLYVYHCATPQMADHMANGMFGMILVEPAGGLPKVDHEYYVMQSEIYTAGPGQHGQLLQLDEAKLLQEAPEYFVFNGALGALTTQYPLTAAVGQSVCIFFGNAGPNATASPHLVGAIFDKYYPFGSLDSAPLLGVQTGSVPPGAAAVFEFQARMPGNFTLVDHAMARMQKGLLASLHVGGADVAHLMMPGPAAASAAPAALAVTAADAAAAQLPASAASLAPALAARLATPAPTAAAAPQSGAPAAPPPESPTAAIAAQKRALRGFLDRLDTSPQYARYAKTMYRLYEARPADVPAGWREEFDSFSNAPEPDPALAAALGTAAALHPVSFVGQSFARVTMTDKAFVPAVIEIGVGEEVRWLNTSVAIHTALDDAAKALNPGDVAMPAGARAFSSPFLQPGQGYALQFHQPGVYRYVCTQHENNGMVGTIVVRPAAGPMASAAHRPPPGSRP